MLASLVVCGYIFITASTIVEHPPWANPLELTLGIITILLLLEATRRVVGIAILVIAALFFFYAIYCNYFPGILTGRGYPISRVIAVMYLSQDGMFGLLLNVVLVVIFSFILLDHQLRRCGCYLEDANRKVLFIRAIQQAPGFSGPSFLPERYAGPVSAGRCNKYGRKQLKCFGK